MTIYREGALIGMEHLMEEAHTGIKSLLGLTFTGMKYLLGWNPYRDKAFTGMEPLLYTGMEPLQG